MAHAMALQRALEHATEYLDGLESRPVGSTVGLDELRTHLGGPLPETGMLAPDVIDELVAKTAGGHLGSTSGRFFAWVIGGALDSALAADWLTSAWNQNAALFSTAPAAAVVEEVVGAWLTELLALPSDASFALTTGCQMAHFTCLAAARYGVLHDAGWDLNELGLFSAPTVRTIVSEQRHGSVDRAARYLGFGNQNIVVVPTNAAGQMDVANLKSALTKHSGPKIVVLNAADLNIAALDDFQELIPLARSHGAWVHIDGAFGLMARASCSKRRLTRGIEHAHSWATDGHKWLNVPFDCGFAFVRDRAAHRVSMTVSADYITVEGQARNEIDWNPEWSRRSRGFTVYAAIKELGRQGLEELIDRSCARAKAIVTGIGRLPGAEVIWMPQLNQGLVRFLDARPGASEADHAAHTDAVIAAVNATGEAFFSGTTWHGKRAMRVSVVNWRTSESDVERTVKAVASVLA
ncbi:MAG TPA: aminotransferase class V-fold PLP-dependent enzyme [Planctomycetaceae bacterium]|jgi:glutamate/tyrosine decarboxylase-like PLP-dependent enzyme|nr:aminotransferase class V-fold PLP-dependent enzyme [Planctomycetaceae bacterium]